MLLPKPAPTKSPPRLVILLVRRLTPYHSNLGKRQVKSPKTYIRDSGILHALLGIETYNDLAGNPIIGSSTAARFQLISGIVDLPS